MRSDPRLLTLWQAGTLELHQCFSGSPDVGNYISSPIPYDIVNSQVLDEWKANVRITGS